MDNVLIASMADAEIENDIYQMHLTKSSGSDGFNANFFSSSLGNDGWCGVRYG